MSEEFEEVERIPWAALAAATPDPRRRLAVVGIGVIALLALVLLAARWLLGPEASADIEPVAASRNSVGTMPTEQSGPYDSAFAEPAPATGSAIYSEADLMAVSVDTETRIATMWAERFVRDYLTVDGDGSIAVEVAQLVAAELPEPPVGLTSFVEWVEAYAVTTTRPARHRVEVAYRLLIGSDGTFVRQPTAAMAVTLDVDVDGTATLAGFPEAIAIPTLRAATAPALTAQIPDWVAERAEAGGASIVGAYRADDVWWVVLMSELAPGVIRPLVVGVEG